MSIEEDVIASIHRQIAQAVGIPEAMLKGGDGPTTGTDAFMRHLDKLADALKIKVILAVPGTLPRFGLIETDFVDGMMKIRVLAEVEKTKKDKAHIKDLKKNEIHWYLAHTRDLTIITERFDNERWWQSYSDLSSGPGQSLVEHLGSQRANVSDGQPEEPRDKTWRQSLVARWNRLLDLCRINEDH